MQYIKQLDTLRAFAVILVIISHWFPKDHWVNFFPNGPIGVDIFFVLSGFLITSILLKNRSIPDINRGRIMKTFYARRVLRIFPIYYLTIFALLAFSDYTNTNIKSDFVYYLTYTSNFKFLMQGHWDGFLSPLWSLAVEEQFYIIWPWLIIYPRKKYLVYIIIAFILVGFSSRLLYNDSYSLLSRILTTSCFDAFGIGALLAWFIKFQEKYLEKFYAVVRIFGLILISIIVYGNIAYSYHYLTIIPGSTANSILAIWLISYIYIHRESENKIFKFLFNSSILIFIGKISYGLYLYHQIIRWLAGIVLNSQTIKSHEAIHGVMNQPYVLLTLMSLFLVMFSWLSYKFVEIPFLRCKRHFSL